MNTTSSFFPNTLFAFDPNSGTETARAEAAALNGRIVALFTRNDEMSSFDDYRSWTGLWAVVWDSATRRAYLRNVQSVDTGGYLSSTEKTPFTVGASLADRQAYELWLNTSHRKTVSEDMAKREVERAAASLTSTIDQLKNPRGSQFGRGDEVVVVRGRKFPKGLKGKVFWTGENQKFGGWTLGLATSDRRDERGRNADVVWVAAHNVERLATGAALVALNDAEARLAEVNGPAYYAQALSNALDTLDEFPMVLVSNLPRL